MSETLESVRALVLYRCSRLFLLGKSSVLNSLLDQSELARAVSSPWSLPFDRIANQTSQSNSGSACTCVVTEFHYHDSDDFDIAVEYFNLQEVKDQFTELLQAYRRYHLRDVNSNEDGGAEFKEKAEIARDTLRAAFGGRLTREEDLLVNETEEAVMNILLEWTRMSRVRLVDGSGDAQRYTVAGLAQCSRRLGELSSELSSERDGAVWPFIRKIKFASPSGLSPTDTDRTGYP